MGYEIFFLFLTTKRGTIIVLFFKQFNIFLNSKLSVEVKINDNIVRAQDELTCVLGECISIGVGVCNALDNPLRDLTLSINFYQDHHNGVNNYRLDTKLSIAGSNKFLLPSVNIRILIIFNSFNLKKKY